MPTTSQSRARAGRPASATYPGNRPCEDHRRRERRARRTARRSRRVPRAGRLRLSAGGPAVACRASHGVERRARGHSPTASHRHHGGGRLSPNTRRRRSTTPPPCFADGKRAARYRKQAAAELRRVRREALFHRGRRKPVVFTLGGIRARPDHLRGRLASRTAGGRGRAPRRSSINGSPFHIGSRIARGARCRRASRRPACRSCTSTWSAARTSWCSTAAPSSWTPTASVALRAPAFEEGFDAVDAGRRYGRRGVPPARARWRRSDEEAASTPRWSGHARLRRQERLPGRHPGPVRRHRLGADAGRGRRCAGRRPRARRADAVALHAPT